jgi:hypothetical protein
MFMIRLRRRGATRLNPSSDASLRLLRLGICNESVDVYKSQTKQTAQIRNDHL